MKKMTTKLFTSLLAAYATLIFFSGCGPKLEEKQKTSIQIPNGEKFRDTPIQIFADADFVTENVVKRSTVGDYLKQTEMMFDILNMNISPEHNAEWKKKAEQSYQEIEKNMTKKEFSYGSSVYLDLVYEQIIGDVSSTIKGTDKKIASDTKKIVELIRTIQKETLILTVESTLREKLNMTQNFLNLLAVEIKKTNIIPEFKELFVTELDQQGKNLLIKAIELDEELVRVQTLSESLKVIRSFLEKTSTQINAEDQKSLQLGVQLSQTLESMKDAQTGLQALALVWTLLNEQQRKTYFKEANEDLYDFLNEKSSEDIQCMCEKNCKGFKTKLVLNLGVYPKIEKFGLKNIADLINQKSLHFVNHKINQVAFDTLIQAGEVITEKVLTSVTQKRSDLGQFKDNFRGHLSEGLEKEFSRQKLKAPMIFLIDPQNSLLDLDAQASYLRNKSKSLSLRSEKNDILQLQFEILEGFLNLPLFSQSPKTGEKTMATDLTDLLLNPEPRQFLKSASNNKSEVHLKQQSELLLTASALLEQMADWKLSSFDSGITSIKADKIITQFKSKDLNRSFFPRGDLTALTLSVASQVLSLMQSENSMLVLVDNQNQILPVQKITDQTSGPIALAAATDFKKGIRIPTANASDMGDFLNALTAFYRATEGIEKTQSAFLLRKSDGENSLLEDILLARQNVRLLIIAIANFISNQLIQSNGLVSKSIALNENFKPLPRYELLDQTRAVDSLLKAYELTKIDVYLWTAKNIYYSMNRLLYSDKIRFYQQSTENEVQSGIDKTKLLETYKNLLPLKLHLSPEEQTQFDKIFAAWLKT